MNKINAKGKNLKQVSQALKTTLNGDGVAVTNAENIHGLAAGLRQGIVVIEGNAGDYLGALNNGAEIKVTKNVGKYAADNMTGGTMIIEGNADYGAAQYCYGGVVVILGDAGDFTATMNKGATVIIAGNVGDEVGTYMLNGDLVVVGDAGENFANYLIRGDVYIGGEWKSLGHNTKIKPLTKKDVNQLQKFFDAYGIDADSKDFQKIAAASGKPFYK